MSHILFLTTNNLATNPRLYKEIILAQEQHHHVTCIQFTLGNWSDKKSEELSNRLYEDMEAKSITKIKSSRTQIINLDATNRDKLSWLKWGLLEQMARIVYPLFKNKRLVNALANSRRSLQILDACAPSEKPDLIIAHNLGAAYPAFRLSQKWQIPFIFDVEDYHPGEHIAKDAINEKARREYLMKTLLPKAAAITSASPLIWEYTAPLIAPAPLLSPRRGEDGEQSLQPHEVILNSFPASEFKIPVQSTSTALKLVWFSQKISFGRGLEQLFEALTSLPPSGGAGGGLHLTLIGDMDPAFDQQIITPFTIHHSPFTIHHIPPLSQPDLHAELANHDVGLALEPGKDLNNKLAISNKIIAYAQAGLYILATDTPAQQQFMAENHERGLVCGQTTSAMQDALIVLSNKRESIQESGLRRFEKGRELAWDKESQKLHTLWLTLLPKTKHTIPLLP